MANSSLRLSFEFFPPKTAQGLAKLKTEQTLLANKNPEFFSVTYGAGGSTRERTVEAVKETAANTGINTAPHLSCVGDSIESLKTLLELYQSMGVKRLVALRGDLPSGMGLGRGDLKYAQDLVAFIREQTGDHFHIEVAAYPEVHPEAKNAKADLLHFKEKVKAGASSAITQYFFNADAYCDFIERCQATNINIPIIPGIMPITDYTKLTRFSDMCGAEIPRWLRKKLESFGEDNDSLRDFGCDFISQLCERLLQAGAPGLHFYTLNQAIPSLSICNKIAL